MTLIEILNSIAGDSTRTFKRPGRPPLMIGNGMHESDDDYDRTPFFQFELAYKPRVGEKVQLSLASYEAFDWELMD